MAEEEFWLAEDHVIRLTALELGALYSFVTAAKGAFPDLTTFQINVKDREPMPMIDRLLEKIEAALDLSHSSDFQGLKAARDLKEGEQ